jgi:hypothetical protein
MTAQLRKEIDVEDGCVLARTHPRIRLDTCAPLLIVLVGVAAYANSVQGAMVLDDYSSIVQNPRVHHLWPIWHLLTDTTRPLVQLSFGINYALGGLQVLGYHLVNLAIHVCAALLLYGLIRRTAQSTGLALSVALLWMVHPLQTESVTYLVQRAESMTGLWYLLTLYALARGWCAVSVLACFAGMATKPVMMTAPLMAWLYDRVFLAGSWRAAWRMRRSYYLGLAGALVFCGVLLVTARHEYSWAAGFSLPQRSIGDYALTQPGVILHYLRLVVWPHPLVLDYAWPVATTWIKVLPPLAVLAMLGWLVWRAWRAQPAIGFLGMAAALLLLPTSSIIPITDLAQEHRMYLPLAPLLMLAVLGLRRLRIATLVVALAVPLCMVMTVQRNHDYRSELAIWEDTAHKRPQNWRAHNNLGVALAQQGRREEAFAHFSEALRLNPSDPDAFHNFTRLLPRQDDTGLK